MARSGQITVSTAGTAVQGPDEVCRLVVIKPLSSNTGVVYVGNDGAGDVASTNGFEMASTASPITLSVNNLQDLWFDAATNGDVLCWIKVD